MSSSVKGSGGRCEQPDLLLGAIAQIADFLQYSSAFLFVDASTAFASIQRQAAIPVEGGKREWMRFLGSRGFTTAEADHIVSEAANHLALIEQGVCPHTIGPLKE